MPRPDTELPTGVRLLRRVGAWASSRPAAALAALGGLALSVSLASAVFVVGNGESGALQRWGRLVDAAVPPGLGVRLPWGIEQLTTVRTGEVLRAEVVGDVSRELALVSGDENLLEMGLVVQYKVSDLGHYLFAVDDPQLLLAQAVRAALVGVVSTMPVDEVLTSGKAQVQNAVRQRAQATLDRLGVGLSLLGVNLRRVSPPAEAAQAFRDVSDARADAARAINEAQSQRERAISLARGDADRLVQEARGRAAARVQQAHGEGDRFARLVERYRVTPEQTGTELYLSTMQSVLPRAHLVLLASGEAPRIDLNLLPRAPR